MHLTLKGNLALLAVALTVVPSLRTISRAQVAPAKIPTCAQPCLDAVLQNSGCSFTRHHCMCAKDGVFSKIKQDIKSKCNPADQAIMQGMADSFCSKHHDISTMTSTTSTACPGAPGASSVTTKASPTTSLASPAVTSTTSLTSVTSALTTPSIATAPIATTYHKTLTYSTTTAAVNGTVAATGGAHKRAKEGIGAAAFAALLGGLGWVFAEL